MTTPQSILYDINYQLKQLTSLMRGEYNKYEDEEYPGDIYDMCKSTNIEISKFNERMVLLEDKMNIIIKLLGKM